MLVYYIAIKDILGRLKKQPERRQEVYQCAESKLMLNVFNGIRQKLMMRSLDADNNIMPQMQASSPKIQPKV
jgi:membrane-bound inhibitor of C-type lysozyme